MKLEDIGWRKYLKNYITTGAVYEFGVYSGKSLIELLSIYKEAGEKITYLYGMDSFEGLPQDSEALWQTCWAKGEFSSCNYFGVNSKEESVEKIKELIRPYLGNTIFVPVIGFYENLVPKDIIKYNMQVASYVDIDVDIYSSAYQALDFLFNNNLVSNDTIFGMDDWGSPSYDTFSSGESRALREICLKYRLIPQKLFQIGNSLPHVHAAFRLIKE